MVLERNEDRVKRGFWPKLTKALASVPFAEEVVAAYYCAFDGATPLRVKGLLLAALAYFIMPFDIVPDVLLGVGFTDDMTVILTTIGLIRNHMKPEHRVRAHEALRRLREGKTVSGT